MSTSATKAPPKPKIYNVYIYNVPPGVRWRDVKNKLVPQLSDSSILHIQIFDDTNSACISLNNEEASEFAMDELEGLDWNGYTLTTTPPPPGQPMADPTGLFIPQYDYLQQELYYAASSAVTPSPMESMISPSLSNIPMHVSSMDHQQYQSQMMPQMIPQMAQMPSMAPMGQANMGMPPPMGQMGMSIPPGMGPPGMMPQRAPPAGAYGYYNYYMPSAPYMDPLTPSFSRHASQMSLHQYGASNFSNANNSNTYTDPTTVQSSPSMMAPYTSRTPTVSLRQLTNLHQYPYHSITDHEHDSVPDKKRLFIGNIPYTTQWMDLKDFLRQVGVIHRVEICSDMNGMSRGFAVATYETEEDALRAVDMLDGMMFQGRKLTVRFDKFAKRPSDVSVVKYNDEKEQEEEKGEGEKENVPVSVLQDPLVEALVLRDTELELVDKKRDDKKLLDDKKYDDVARNLIESLILK